MGDQRSPQLTMVGVVARLAQAQVRDRGEGSVIQVVRIDQAVAVAVAAELSPRGRDDLEWAHRAIPGRVPVHLAAVGIRDRLGPSRPVELAAPDRWLDITVGVQLVLAVDSTVAGLDLRDPTHDGPMHFA